MKVCIYFCVTCFCVCVLLFRRVSVSLCLRLDLGPPLRSWRQTRFRQWGGGAESAGNGNSPRAILSSVKEREISHLNIAPSSCQRSDHDASQATTRPVGCHGNMEDLHFKTKINTSSLNQRSISRPSEPLWKFKWISYHRREELCVFETLAFMCRESV